MDDFTPRNVAKYVVKGAITMKAAQFAKDTLAENTRFDEDDMIVKIGAGVFGWGVGAKLSPYTDKAVDKTADFINKKREARKAKKEATTEK
ncbi:MAG TPA: hypothetical protein VEO92_05125 [Candidatus Nitrosocosmicus sp.]|nr:hypothetical protein [Candidatus Nitrosocosmicus sp.]